MRTNVPKLIVIHCTDVSWKSLRDQYLNVNAYHKGEGFLLSSLGSYVGYHHLLTGGKDYKCKEDFEEGCHCNQVYNGLPINLSSIGLCTGFNGDIEMPHPVDYANLQGLVWAYQDKYGIANKDVYFHRHFNVNKTCPGSLCDDAWLAKLLTRPTPPPVDIEKPVDQEAKQKQILAQKISLLQQIINLWNQLKNAKPN